MSTPDQSSEVCPRCAEYDEEHGPQCPLHPDHDPTPWCLYHGSRENCDCAKWQDPYD
jgi:hypothetical protein